jgi:hypothetical protein
LDWKFFPCFTRVDFSLSPAQQRKKKLKIMIKNKKQRQNEINTSKLVTPRQTQLSLVTMIRRGLASGCLASLLNAVKRQSCTPSHLENKCRKKK